MTLRTDGEGQIHYFEFPGPLRLSFNVNATRYVSLSTSTLKYLNNLVSFWRMNISLPDHHTSPSAQREEREGEREKHIFSECIVEWGMPLNLGVFSCTSLFCVQAMEVHCVGRHPEKRGELGAVVCRCFCSARALKRPEWSSAIGSSRPEPRDNATGQLWRPATIKNAASLY